jgi:hypothetical protein
MIFSTSIDLEGDDILYDLPSNDDDFILMILFHF